MEDAFRELVRAFDRILCASCEKKDGSGEVDQQVEMVVDMVVRMKIVCRSIFSMEVPVSLLLMVFTE